MRFRRIRTQRNDLIVLLLKVGTFLLLFSAVVLPLSADLAAVEHSDEPAMLDTPLPTLLSEITAPVSYLHADEWSSSCREPLTGKSFLPCIQQSEWSVVFVFAHWSLRSIESALLVVDLRKELERQREQHPGDEPVLFYTVNLQTDREVAAGLDVVTAPTIVLLEQFQEEEEEEAAAKSAVPEAKQSQTERNQEDHEKEDITSSTSADETLSESPVPTTLETETDNSHNTTSESKLLTRLIFHTYSGPTDVDHLVRFVERAMRPPITVIRTTEELGQLLRSPDMMLIGYFPPVDSNGTMSLQYNSVVAVDGEIHDTSFSAAVDLDATTLQDRIYDSFSGVAHSAPLLRQRITFYLTSDPEALHTLVHEPSPIDAVVSLFFVSPVRTRSISVEYLLQQAENATQALRHWIAEQAFDPALVRLSRDNIVRTLRQPTLALFMDHLDPTTVQRDALAELWRETPSTLTVSFMNISPYPALMERLGICRLPAAVLFNPAEGEHFVLPQELTDEQDGLAGQLIQFYESFKHQQAVPYLRTVEETESTKRQSRGNVEEVVGSTFLSSVVYSETPLLLLFTRPGCGGCVRAEVFLEEASERFTSALDERDTDNDTGSGKNQDTEAADPLAVLLAELRFAQIRLGPNQVPTAYQPQLFPAMALFLPPHHSSHSDTGRQHGPAREIAYERPMLLHPLFQFLFEALREHLLESSHLN